MTPCATGIIANCPTEPSAPVIPRAALRRRGETAPSHGGEDDREPRRAQPDPEEHPQTEVEHQRCARFGHHHEARDVDDGADHDDSRRTQLVADGAGHGLRHAPEE